MFVLVSLHVWVVTHVHAVLHNRDIITEWTSNTLLITTFTRTLKKQSPGPFHLQMFVITGRQTDACPHPEELEDTRANPTDYGCFNLELKQ